MLKSVTLSAKRSSTPTESAVVRHGTSRTKTSKTPARQNNSSVSDKQAVLSAINRSQAMIEFKLDGTILYANDNFLNAVGYTLPEIQGKHHSIFVDDAYRTSAEYRDFWASLNRGEYQAG